jgi:hypothetical protein
MRSFKLLLVFCVFMLFGAESSLACTCAPSQSASQELERATAVFSGKVVEIKRHKQRSNLFGSVEVKFKVNKVWKGVDEKTISIFTSSQSAACGYGFRAGRTYLVYAHGNEEGRLTTSICSRTRRLKDAREDLQELGAGKGVAGKILWIRSTKWRLAACT